MQKEKNLYTTPSIRLTCSIQQKVCIKRAGNIYEHVRTKNPPPQNRQIERKYSIQYSSIPVHPVEEPTMKPTPCKNEMRMMLGIPPGHCNARVYTRGFDPTEKKHPSPDYITPFVPATFSFRGKGKIQKCSFQVVIFRLFWCLRWLFGECIVFHFAFSSMNMRGFFVFGVFER